nr:RNA-directed DNA polymerase, eukaryota [Tanacetum cinerariifolium]
MGSYRSKEDEILKISTSVFVANFSDSFGAKDLWNTCKQYGQVVDAYIPYRRSKAGKRFGFVRFIKVLDVDRLVNNLCTVWVGRHKLQANILRFQREPLKRHSSLHNIDGMKRGSQSLKMDSDLSPVMVLDDSCLKEKDYSLCLMGKVDGFGKFIEDSWKDAPIESNALVRMMKNLSEGENNVVNRRTEAIEGDENSKHYHGVINKKRNQLSICGILVEGTWIDSPSLVKIEFLSHFKNLFEQPNSNRLHMDMHFSNTLSSVQVADLECQVSKEEIKRRCEIVGLISLLPQMDLRLIQSCLRSSRGSVIVNGSPTEEFQFYKGLKQDDLLSPFLFILAMESLHISFQRVVDVGSKVGGCMSRIQSWNETIERMACRLSKWKLQTLSIGGSPLWARVIKALHGYDGKIGQRVKSCYSSLWLDIIHEVKMFKSRGIDLVSLIHSKLGNGENISFWEVAWRGRSPFKSLFLRLYALETQKKIDVASKLSLDVSFRRPPRGGVEIQQFEHMKEKVEGCILADMMDRWFWALEGSGEFTITSVRKMIDEFMLPDASSKTRWIKAVPIKVNMHAWKVKLDGLPTRLNISRRGIDIESILCPMCGKAVELTSHIFFTCQMSKKILRKISRWWDIVIWRSPLTKNG